MSKLSNVKLDFLIDLHQEEYIESALDYNVSLAVNELKKYRDLEEQGLLLKLPCRAGDKLWWINRGVLIESEVINFVIDEDGMFIRVKYLNDKEHNYYYGCPFEFDDIGKIAFLTREEAEQELKVKECAE